MHLSNSFGAHEFPNRNKRNLGITFDIILILLPILLFYNFFIDILKRIDVYLVKFCD